MYRLFVIFSTCLHFGIDDIIVSLLKNKWGNRWRQWRKADYNEPKPVRLRLALEKLGPIFVKFGQQISTRGDIVPLGYIEELEKLQDKVPPETPEVIRECVEQLYKKDLESVFAEFDMIPVGSASVAQVHKARLVDDDKIVAIKILRPAIEAQLQKDIRLLKRLATMAQWLMKDSHRIKPKELVAEFERQLNAEVDLLREASNCSQIYRQSQDNPHLRIPKVYWQWCNKKIMVMEFIESTPIAKVDFAKLSIDRSSIAKSGITIFFNQVFRDNFFHADMHPGNIHLDAEGQYVFLDYGIVGQLSDFDKEYLLRNFLAFFNRDYRSVAQMHVEAGWVPATVNIGEFEAQLRIVCDPIFAQPLKNISFGVFLLRMFQTARQFDLEVQPQLILLQKTLLNVEGIGRFLDPNLNMWEVAKPIVEHWASQQYNPRKALSILQKQWPDIQYILKEGPLVIRTLIQQNKNNRPKKTSAKSYFVGGFLSATLVALFLYFVSYL